MKKITPYARINKIVFDYAKFKTIDDFQDYVRNAKKENTPDYIAIDNILYTMEEYDGSGKQITYHNMRTGNTIIVNTENRYKLGYKDAQIDFFENYGISRNDISYAD